MAFPGVQRGQSLFSFCVRPSLDGKGNLMAVLDSILEIDLDEKSVSFSPFPEDRPGCRLSGRGYNVAHLLETVPAGVDPLGPENVLLISCGLLTGTKAPASSRIQINALSPQTGLLGSSSVGGNFGTYLRRSGIQAIVVRGRAPAPVYILIDGARIEIRQAATLWGRDTVETNHWIQQDIEDAKASILSIGPAGENAVPFACIMTDRDHAAGRTGMGAVMGAKHLKAVVVKKQASAHTASSLREREIINEYVQRIRQSPQFKTLSTHGGAGYVKWADDMGILATRNYQANRYDAADRVDGQNLTRYKRRSRGCPRCPVLCKAELFFDEGSHKGTAGVRPEFETMVSFGPKCGLDDPGAVVELDNLCGRLGLDTISAGGVIAFAMDLYERGILTSGDTGGLALTWGNQETMATLIGRIARLEGFGAVLSRGVHGASRIIGRGSQHFAPHVKGLELCAYHPDGLMGTALAYAVSSRGGDFNYIYPSLEYTWTPERARKELGDEKAVDPRSTRGKGALIKRAMLVNIIFDCLGICKVPALSLLQTFDLQNEARLANLLTGRDMDVDFLYREAERIANMERLFNIRHGAGPKDDCLPAMFFEKSPSPGGKPLKQPDWLKPMVQDFYNAMGWTEEGIPTAGTMQKFGLQQENG